MSGLGWRGGGEWYLKGLGNLESRSRLGITGVVMWLVGPINVLTKYP